VIGTGATCSLPEAAASWSETSCNFYVSGRQGVPGTSLPGICSTGLAKLRRDGFASMEIDDGSIRRVSHDLPAGTLVTAL